MPKAVNAPRDEEGTRAFPLKTYGWRWRGRPLDFYALIVLVLAPGEMVGLFMGTGKLGIGFQLVRSLPILLIAIIVTVLAVFRPEALHGERPRRVRPKTIHPPRTDRVKV